MQRKYNCSSLVSLDEHVAVQRENKVRTLLLQALPEDHMPDFHHYDDARDIWMAVKARFGGNEESKKMKKTMLKQQFAEFFVTEEEGLHKGYDRFQKILRALPSSWAQLLCSKTRGGLESISFDDLYNKLRSLELDVRIGHKRIVHQFLRLLIMIYEGFDRLISWRWKDDLMYRRQMAMLSLRINRRTKALVSVDSMVNCPDHAAEIRTGAVEKDFHGDFGVDEVFGLSTPSVFYSGPVEKESDLRKHSDKSSDSETHASCDSSLKTQTKDIPPAVDIQTLPESDVEDPNSTTGSPSFSCSENVKSPRIICNKSGVNNRKWISPASVPAGRSDFADSRNRPSSPSAGRSWSKRPAIVSAGRPGSAGWLNPAARPYFRPSSVYFDTPTNLYDPMFMDKGRWDTAVKTSAGVLVQIMIIGGIVKFGGGDGRISGKDTLRIQKLDFEMLYYTLIVLVLSEEFQLPDARFIVITNPHNKTPYELISGKVPQIGHLKPFGCQVTILNTSDYLGKFEGKADDGYLVGYASNSKAYRVYNLPNKRVEETLNLRFLEDKPNVQGIGHEWYFDLDYLTDSLGYTRFKTDTPAGTQETNINAGTQDHDSDSEVDEQVIVVPSFPSNRFVGPSFNKGPSIMERNADYAEELAKLQRQEYEAKDAAARYGYLFSQATAEILCQAEAEIRNQGVSAVRDPAGIDSAVRDPAGIDSAVRDTAAINSAGDVSAGSPSAGSDPAGGNPADSSQPAGSFEPAEESNPAVSSSVSADFIHVYADESTLPPGQSLGSSANTTRFPLPSDVCMDQLSSGIFTSSSYDDDFRATLTNLAPAVEVHPVPTKRVNTIHPQSQILGDLASPVLTRKQKHQIQVGEKCFHWICSKEMQQFINRQYGNLSLSLWQTCNRDNIDFEETSGSLRHSLARIEAIRLFLAFASYMGFLVYQLDVKSAFLYGEIEEEVYVTQPKGFEDPYFPKHVYRVVKALYGLHQAPRAWYARLSTFLLQHNYRRGTIDKTLFIKKDSRDIILVQVYVDDIIFGSTNKAWCDEFEVLMKGEFEMSAMGEMTFFLGLQVKQLPDGLFISQDKYIKDMLTKFDMESVRTATTPYEAANTKLKDETDPPVNVHLYRSMIGSLMYLTASRPDIMFAVSACSRHQVTPLTSHLNAVKKIFKYLKGHPKLGLWYPKDSPFQLEAYSDSDYAGSHGDRKSTTGGCQFLGRRLISWQCKKQTIVATSSTEAEYVAAASCCAQVLWIQNQLLDYGFNFMNTKIFIDNQSTICIVKNPVFHQRTKHIEIRHHFIRDANEKNLIQVLKIHTDDNVADLLTKAFDGPRFAYLVVHIGMVVNTTAGSSMFLLVVILPAASLVSAGSSMFLLVVIPPAASLVSAGSSMFLLVVILPAASLVSAGSSMFLLVVIPPAASLVSAGSSMFLRSYPLLQFGLCFILPAARLVSAGWSMVLLVVIFPAARLVSAGCTMVLLEVIVPAGFFVPAVYMVSAVG
ncbi:putative ribonuclease H-like domain-containing protein [Tanacetum coccineum]